jgi:hypothetical protein
VPKATLLAQIISTTTKFNAWQPWPPLPGS